MQYLLIAAAITCFSLPGLVTEAAARENNRNEFYLSVHGGAFKYTDESFHSMYDTESVFSYGLGLGIPIFGPLHGYGKIILMQTSAYPPGIFPHTPKAYLNHRIGNVGIRTTFPLGRQFSVDIMSGLSYDWFREELRWRSGGTENSTRNGLIGFFGGGGMEYVIQNLPLALFGEIQYNNTFSDREDSHGFHLDLRGFHFSSGIRLFFPLQ